MGKIREFFRNLFSVSNLLTGMIGMGIGMGLYVLNRFIAKYTFQDIIIFIGTGVSFVFIIFSLGFLMNKTLFKDED